MGKIANVTFLSQTDNREHTAEDLTLFYVIRGNAEVRTQDSAYRLQDEDVLSVNPPESYRLHIQSGVTALIDFRHEELYALLGGRTRIVRCCSANVRDGSFNHLRFQVRSLVRSLMEGEFGAVSFEKESCGLLLTLLSEYSQEYGANDRKQEAAAWIENVSQDAVTLEDAAEHFHLTPQYFSRWFASAFGCSFIRYLSRVRCEKAKRDLLETDQSILRIALEHGFPNAASFTKTFTEQYGQTPLEYRKRQKPESVENSLSIRDVQPYLEWEAEQDSRRVPVAEIDCGALHTRLVPYWNTLCTLSSLSGLGDLEMQDQVLHLRKAFPFRQARLHLQRGDTADFYREDRALSFLDEAGVSPLLVLEYPCGQEEAYLSWLEELVRHSMRRFGIRKYQLEVLLAPSLQRENSTAYSAFIGKIRSLFRSIRAECILFGPGLRLNGDGSNLACFLEAKPELDCVTIRCAPVGTVRTPEWEIPSVPDTDALMNQYRLGREVLHSAGVWKELLVSGWRNGFAERDPLRDSSWAGAELLRTAFTGYGILPSLPLECPLDILAENDHTIFRGREGLLTINQLRKPSFYALRFLKHLDAYFLYADRHMIVTASDDGYFQIALQNACPLSWQFFTRAHTPQDAPSSIPESFFESRDPFRVRLRLTGVGSGTWLMKTRVVNETAGNVYHAWLSLNYPDTSFMGRDEMELLRGSSLPGISGSVLSSQDGVLEMTITLGSNEIKHIHLIPTG